jgi:cell division protein FtsX
MSASLSPEDQRRVNKVICQGVNQVERKPFRGWVLLAVILLVLTLLSVFSYGIAVFHGVV